MTIKKNNFIFFQFIQDLILQFFFIFFIYLELFLFILDFN